MKGKAFLYFKEFQWNTKQNDHPKEGSVYLAVDQKDSFIVPFEDGTGLFLEKDGMSGEFQTWNCDVEEVTFDNLLELPIKADDIKMMANIEDVAAPVVEDQDGYSSIVEELGSSLFMLREHDEEYYEALVSMMTIISDGLVGGKYIELTNDLSWNPATAKIANVTAATLQIESYLNEADPTKIGDLLNAIYTLTVEIIRKHKFMKNEL